MVTWGEIGTCPGPHTGMFCRVDCFVNRVRHWGFGNAMRGSARRMMALVAAHDVKLNGRFDSPCLEMSRTRVALLFSWWDIALPYSKCRANSFSHTLESVDSVMGQDTKCLTH